MKAQKKILLSQEVVVELLLPFDASIEDAVDDLIMQIEKLPRVLEVREGGGWFSEPDPE